MPVTCSGATPHYSSGYAMLLAFDVNNDGKIDSGELGGASTMKVAGRITDEEYAFIESAYNAGSINALCPRVTPPPTAITCSGATPHYPSGCDLLLAYDYDNDGIISTSEKNAAGSARGNLIITAEEYDFIVAAYNAGSVNALCPGCYGAPTPPPTMETRTMLLEEGKSYSIQVQLLPDYETLNATIYVSSTGVTCTVGPCGTTGPPGVVASGWTVTTYLKTAAVVGDVCSWITGLGGWRNLQWTSHVLEAYYVYIGADGHSVGFSPVTWNDVLGLYYYYINDPTAGNGKIGCGT